MADAIPMVTSCPLCLAPDEVESMVTVEIERAIPKGRAAILICRNCTRAVIRAAQSAEPELAEMTAWYDRMVAKSQPASEPSAPEDTSEVAPEAIDPVGENGFTGANEAYPCPPNCFLKEAGVEHTHTRKEWENG